MAYTVLPFARHLQPLERQASCSPAQYEFFQSSYALLEIANTQRAPCVAVEYRQYKFLDLLAGDGRHVLVRYDQCNADRLLRDQEPFPSNHLAYS